MEKEELLKQITSEIPRQLDFLIKIKQIKPKMKRNNII